MKNDKVKVGFTGIFDGFSNGKNCLYGSTNFYIFYLTFGVYDSKMS